MMPETKMLNCSFCGKSRDSVEKLIAGPNVYICNECVVLSYNIVQKIDKPEEESETDYNRIMSIDYSKENFVFLQQSYDKDIKQYIADLDNKNGKLNNENTYLLINQNDLNMFKKVL